MEEGPATVRGALQSSLYELRPDKSLEVGGRKERRLEDEKLRRCGPSADGGWRREMKEDKKIRR